MKGFLDAPICCVEDRAQERQLMSAPVGSDYGNPYYPPGSSRYGANAMKGVPAVGVSECIIITKVGSLNTNFNSERNLPDVSTRCSRAKVNCNGGLEIPDRWMVTLMSGACSCQPLTFKAVKHGDVS